MAVEPTSMGALSPCGSMRRAGRDIVLLWNNQASRYRLDEKIIHEACASLAKLGARPQFPDRKRAPTEGDGLVAYISLPGVSFSASASAPEARWI